MECSKSGTKGGPSLLFEKIFQLAESFISGATSTSTTTTAISPLAPISSPSAHGTRRDPLGFAGGFGSPIGFRGLGLHG